LLTPQGPKAIETFQVGDEILTRLEWEPDAPVLVSQVEARFENVARIWHLHLASGQVIRTTAEHPFYVDGRGWVPAGELRPGDLLVSHDGRRVAVAELYDTGQYERVYNLAIRSFHTYFVCDETWPFSVWAHNSCHQFSLLKRRGIELSDHAMKRLAERMVTRGIREIDVLDAYTYGRLFFDPKYGSYIRYSARTKVAVAVNLPSNGKILTVFEGGISPRWQPVRWRPGILD
jgi:hypothetical protein